MSAEDNKKSPDNGCLSPHTAPAPAAARDRNSIAGRDLRPADEAMRRMIGRFVSTGRIIPPNYLEAVAPKPAHTYDKLKGPVDAYAKIDNAPGRGKPRNIIEDPSGRPSRVLKAELERSADLGRSGGARGSGRGQAAESAQGTESPAEDFLNQTGPAAAVTNEISRADAMLQRFEGCVIR